jgi:hypothetical protein
MVYMPYAHISWRPASSHELLPLHGKPMFLYDVHLGLHVVYV